MNQEKRPATLSALWALGLQDMRLSLKNPFYHVDSDYWHSPASNNKKCTICLAGGVMSQTLQCDPLQKSWPQDFPRYWSHALVAIDYLRKGAITLALETFETAAGQSVDYCDCDLADIKTAWRKRFLSPLGTRLCDLCPDNIDNFLSEADNFHKDLLALGF